MVPDVRDRRVGCLVGPDCVDRALTPRRGAEVGGVPLPRAVGCAICPRQQRHIDILARDVMDRRIWASQSVSTSRVSAMTRPATETITRLRLRSTEIG